MTRLKVTGCLLLFTLFNLREARQYDNAFNKYRPSRPPGGPFPVTPPDPNPGFRWTFEGINYDSPPHQVATNINNKEYGNCLSDYVRCLMRDSKPAEMCAIDSWTGYYYKFNSICDIERENCFFTQITYASQYKTLDFTMNRFLYDGEGWLADKDTGPVQGESRYNKWYCYWGDTSFFLQNLRRTRPTNPRALSHRLV